MAYTASALALLLGPLPAPVVLTGAQRPLAEARTDARENLVDAAHVATLAVPEVAIVFASACYAACRATKRDAWALALRLAELRGARRARRRRTIAPHVNAPSALAPFDVASSRACSPSAFFPASKSDSSRARSRAGVKGSCSKRTEREMFRRASGVRSFPAIEHARDRQVPVVIVVAVPSRVRGFRRVTRRRRGARRGRDFRAAT